LHLAATNRYTLSGQEKAREGRIAPEARAISDLTYDNLERVKSFIRQEIDERRNVVKKLKVVDTECLRISIERRRITSFFSRDWK